MMMKLEFFPLSAISALFLSLNFGQVQLHYSPVKLLQLCCSPSLYIRGILLNTKYRRERGLLGNEENNKARVPA